MDAYPTKEPIDHKLKIPIWRRVLSVIYTVMSNLVAEFLVLFTYVNVGEVNKSNAFPLCFSKEYRLLQHLQYLKY